ncbi:hypothetical protein S7335_541 [Synechococcus sp. PCC 7335]|uniref:hypothetical protein n=1 Tax=Synechococcus sp. (strain ATCC 29403 / PCC 7335) TaxID=91464 RepID=UPI00017EC471|nr:hypothetical protein [Synechococcus sp. PCC 7335]EDX83361.1 hypothetical protein S7335_541 [Synechococcus sp. PCC 7335]
MAANLGNDRTSINVVTYSKRYHRPATVARSVSAKGSLWLAEITPTVLLYRAIGSSKNKSYLHHPYYARFR